MLQVGPQIYYGITFLLSPTTDLDLIPHTKPGYPNFLSSQHKVTPFFFLPFSHCFLILGYLCCVLWLTKSYLAFVSPATYQVLFSVVETI